MEQEKEMEDILTTMGVSSNVKDKFKAEKIYVSTVPLLTVEQLRELGVTTVGEQVVLKESCRQAQGYDKIAS
uniref:Uncharacterized protein n=1 Tax=Amphimedon queenslandica TaxID=400682 RepID=A0A1X7SNI0_AMPQE